MQTYSPENILTDSLQDCSLHLEGQIVVLLLLVGPQSVPPLPQDFADCPVVLVGVSLVHQGTVAFAEDHERIHGTADVVLLPLVGDRKRTGSSDIFVKLLGVTFINPFDGLMADQPSCLRPSAGR